MQLDTAADPKALCRVCMTPEMEQSVNLYDPFPFGQHSLHEMLRAICAPVFAKSGPEDDMPEMPTKVCLACRNATVAAYSLHLQCIETDRRLGELVALMWELQEPGGDMVVEYGGDLVASSSREETVPSEPMDVSVDNKNGSPKGENTCSECGKSFATRWTLIRHKRDGWCDKTNDPKQRTCKICNKVLKTVQLLKRHRQMHISIESDESSPAPEPGDNPVEENTDNVEMVKVEPLDLVDGNENEDSLLEEVGNAECSQCGISFSSIRAHRDHTKEGNCLRVKAYPCRICGKVFDKQSRRQYHMYSHRERVACTRCDETFRTACSLKAHIRRKRCSGNKLNVTQAELETQAGEQDQMQDEENDAEEETSESLQVTMPAPEGDASAERKEQAEEQNLIEEEENYAEEEANEAEDDQDQMEGEEDDAEDASEDDTSSERTEAIDIQCTDCGVSFLSKMAHRRHTLEGDCQQKPTFPCKLCGKIFDKLTRMTYHFYTHKARFSCSMCSEKFRSEDKLQKHLNRCSAMGSSPTPEEDGMNEPLIEQALLSSTAAFRDPLLTSDALEVVKVEEPEIDDAETKLKSEIIVEPFPINDGRKTCKICLETFERRVKYRYHMRRNHQLHVCGRCHEMFETEQILADHKKTNHATVINCPKCEKSFESQRAFQRHKKDGSCLPEPEQTPKPFPCDLCDKTFDTAVRLGYHKNNHNNRTYCDHCGKQFQSKAVLEMHLARGICLGEKARTCLACKKVFETVLEYKKHRQEVHPGPVVCLDCGRKLASLHSLYTHVKDGRCETIRSRKPATEFPCKICGEVQPSVSQRRSHMKAKHLEQIFSCAPCLANFPTKEKFDAHMKKHEQNLVNVCRTCNTSFPSMKMLKKHKFTHLTRVKCYVCEKDFRTNSDLRVHMTIHTGEKAYKCDLCPRQFNTSTKRNCHIQTIHSTKPNKEPTSFVCEQCASMFTSPYSLKAHIMAKHEGIRPYPCTQCDLKFARSRQLERHKLTHTKERPFKCVVCPQAFLECSELVRHVGRAHSDGNPYACDRCDKSFRFIAELRKHYADHAQEGFDSSTGATDVRFTSVALLNMRFAKEKQRRQQQQQAEEGDDSE